MNEASFKYTAYKALLEGEITREQYEFITEAGLASRIIKSLKAAGGALTKTYKDEAYKDVQEYASKQLQKIVKQIYQAGAKAGQDRAQIDPVVSMILNQALVDSKIENPAMVFRALDKNPEALEAVSEPSAASSGGEEGSAGTTITTDTLKSNPRVTAALAASVLPDKKDAIEAAVEKGKEISPDFFYDGLAKRASENTGVKEEVAHKIVMALVDAGRIKMSAKLETMLESAKTRRSGNVILERWQVLAGVNRGSGLLSEVDVPDDMAAAFKKNKPVAFAVDKLTADEPIDEDDLKDIRGQINTKRDLKPFEKTFEDLVDQVKKKSSSQQDSNKSPAVANVKGEGPEPIDKEGLKELSDRETDTYEGDLNAYKSELEDRAFFPRSNKFIFKFDYREKDKTRFDDELPLYLNILDQINSRSDWDEESVKKKIQFSRQHLPSTKKGLARIKKLENFLKEKLGKGDKEATKGDSGASGSIDSEGNKPAAEGGAEDLGKIKPILGDIRKKVTVEDASDKDVVSVLNFIKDKVKAIELSTAA